MHACMFDNSSQLTYYSQPPKSIAFKVQQKLVYTFIGPRPNLVSNRRNGMYLSSGFPCAAMELILHLLLYNRGCGPH